MATGLVVQPLYRGGTAVVPGATPREPLRRLQRGVTRLQRVFCRSQWPFCDLQWVFCDLQRPFRRLQRVFGRLQRVFGHSQWPFCGLQWVFRGLQRVLGGLQWPRTRLQRLPARRQTAGQGSRRVVVARSSIATCFSDSDRCGRGRSWNSRVAACAVVAGICCESTHSIEAEWDGRSTLPSKRRRLPGVSSCTRHRPAQRRARPATILPARRRRAPANLERGCSR